MPYDDSSLKKSLMGEREPAREYVDKSLEDKEKKRDKKLTFLEWMAMQRKKREKAIEAVKD